MKSETFDSSSERICLSYLIYHAEVIRAILPTFEKSRTLFRTALANQVLRWVVSYYEQYNEAPCESIRWMVEEEQNNDRANSLSSLLEALPPKSEYSPRMEDKLSNYFDEVSYSKLANSILSRLAQKDTEGCNELLANYKRPTLGVSHGIDPFNNDEALKDVFNDDSYASLLRFNDLGPDALEFFGDTFARSSFVVFNASEKAGKTTLLLDLAVRAYQEGRSVAYFEAGDMSQRQIFRRLYQRISGTPRRPGNYLIPDRNFCVLPDEKDDKPSIQIDFTKKYFDEGIDESIARRSTAEWFRKYGETGSRFKFSAHPQNLTVPQISTILDEWERADGFIPDFVIIDYADILMPVIKNDFRHQVNDTFARLRGLSLARKCCLVTATQAKASAFEAEYQTRMALSEDKRKAAYPTAILGLGSTQEERSKQVAKLNFIVRRDDVCDETVHLYLAQCLALCNPMVQVFLSRKSPLDAMDDVIDVASKEPETPEVPAIEAQPGFSLPDTTLRHSSTLSSGKGIFANLEF